MQKIKEKDNILKRLIIIVLDSVGIGFLPDADAYGDIGANTLGHIAELSHNLYIPHLTALGLGNIDMNNKLPKTDSPSGSYTKSAQKSAGKDTTTGHWEIAGVRLDKPFPVFEKGFPVEIIKEFEAQTGIQTIGNYAASGTEIIKELGDLHCSTGKLIVYTSADSVFQIAMHEGIYPIERQYEICTIARNLLQGEFGVGRVIARPFTGESGNYTRTSNRKDFSLTPPETLLDTILKNDMAVHAIGKIYDIFAGKGITSSLKTPNNDAGISETIRAVKEKKDTGLIFTNLVDFDMHFGHRRDVEGYAQCLNDFDRRLPEILSVLEEEDILIITADHGNDPSFKGTDHTREYIPILIYGSKIKKGNRIPDRATFADIAATAAERLGIQFDTNGKSFLQEIIIH